MTAEAAKILAEEFLLIAADVRRVAAAHMRATDPSIVAAAVSGLKPPVDGPFALFCAHTDALMTINNALHKLADDVRLEIDEMLQ